jgi:hypothetical protein
LIPAAGSIAVPSDFFDHTDVFDANGEKVLSRDRSVVVRGQQDTAPAPDSYVVFGRTIYTAPKPETSYTVTLDYIAIPARILDEAAETGLPPEVEDASVDYAVAECWSALEEPGRYADSMAIYSRRRGEANNDLEGSYVLRDDWDPVAFDWR